LQGEPSSHRQVKQMGYKKEIIVKKISLASVLLLIAALALSSVGLAAEPIKFGAVNPLGDITGYQTTRAMELAVKEINEAGGGFWDVGRTDCG
jgi:ABC-type branched-subunit amino acid transport system substrate-binding protein